MVASTIKVKGKQEYHVEAIVSHQVFWVQPQYIVLFVGYDASEKMWWAEQ